MTNIRLGQPGLLRDLERRRPAAQRHAQLANAPNHKMQMFFAPRLVASRNDAPSLFERFDHELDVEGGYGSRADRVPDLI